MLASRPRAAAGGGAFLLLTVGVFWYQFHRIQRGEATPHWDQLRWEYFLLGVLCLPIESLAAATRTAIVCRTLHPGVRFRTCLRAEWANAALNMLTPCHAGGGPAQIYIMSRAGVGVGVALTISLISFAGTLLGLLSVGIYTLLAPGGRDMRALSVTSVATLAAITTVMGLAAVRPEAFRIVLGTISRVCWRLRGRRDALPEWRPPDDLGTGPADRLGRVAGALASLVYTYRGEVHRFFRASAVSVVWIYLLSLAFLASRGLLAYASVRFLGLEGQSLRHIVEIQVALAFLVLFAPTPGAAGIAEAASLSLMADVVPVGYAPYYNLLWRFSTAYLAAIAGLTCLAVALVEHARSARKEAS